MAVADGPSDGVGGFDGDLPMLPLNRRALPARLCVVAIGLTSLGSPAEPLLIGFMLIQSLGHVRGYGRWFCPTLDRFAFPYLLASA